MGAIKNKNVADAIAVPAGKIIPLNVTFTNFVIKSLEQPRSQNNGLVHDTEREMLLHAIASNGLDDLIKRAKTTHKFIRQSLAHTQKWADPTARHDIMLLLAHTPVHESNCKIIWNGSRKKIGELSDRQKVIIDSLASAWSKADIADAMNLTLEDVEHEVKTLIQEKGFKNENEMAAMGVVQNIREKRHTQEKRAEREARNGNASITGVTFHIPAPGR